MYLYLYNYKPEYKEICNLEIKSIFGNEVNNEKYIISDIDIDINLSPFIKYKIDILYSEDNIDIIVNKLDDDSTKDFLIKYVDYGDTTTFTRRKEVDFCISLGNRYVHDVNFKNPKILYGITNLKNKWFYGKLIKNNKEYIKRNKKPVSYSNSLDIVVSKACTNIVTNSNKSLSIIDPCCGVGTVVIEGKKNGYNIKGSDINFKVVNNANTNLEYFDLIGDCKVSDINNIKEKYDCCIIDLPYGLFSITSDEITRNIIVKSKEIANKALIICSKDVSILLKELDIEILERCKVIKK